MSYTYTESHLSPIDIHATSKLSDSTLGLDDTIRVVTSDEAFESWDHWSSAIPSEEYEQYRVDVGNIDMPEPLFVDLTPPLSPSLWPPSVELSSEPNITVENHVRSPSPTSISVDTESLTPSITMVEEAEARVEYYNVKRDVLKLERATAHMRIRETLALLKLRRIQAVLADERVVDIDNVLGRAKFDLTDARRKVRAVVEGIFPLGSRPDHDPLL